MKKLIRDFFNKYFFRQHPDAALRYYPVVEAIKKAKLEDSKILEVGSGGLGITPYLKKNIDGLDVYFDPPLSDMINRIKGSADKLPFRKNSYDVVICVDVLEHINSQLRQSAIFEMIRVAKKLAIIVVPQGTLSEQQDQELNNYWQKTFHNQNRFLEEHVQNGLPKTEEILVTIDKSLRKLDKKAKVTSRPYLNLAVRKVIMRTWISNNKFLYYLYLKGYLLLLPVLKLANWGNCYRRAFVIEFAS